MLSICYKLNIVINDLKVSMTQNLDAKYSLTIITMLNNLDKILKAKPRCATKYLIINDKWLLQKEEDEDVLKLSLTEMAKWKLSLTMMIEDKMEGMNLVRFGPFWMGS